MKYLKKFNESKSGGIIIDNNYYMRKMVLSNEHSNDLNHWDVSMSIDMSEAFSDTTFNGDISKWDVSSVQDMTKMFSNSCFNGIISNWNVKSVVSMREMFSYSVFNGDISKWKVLSVKTMENMFLGAGFDGDINDWKVSFNCDLTNMFENCPINKKLPVWYILIGFDYKLYNSGSNYKFNFVSKDGSTIYLKRLRDAISLCLEENGHLISLDELEDYIKYLVKSGVKILGKKIEDYKLY